MMIKPYIANFILAMLAITNPFGNLAIFLGLTSDKTTAERRRIAIITCISVAIVLLIAVWSGDYILQIFGISLPAFQVAGGIIITLIGLSMLQSKQSAVMHTKEEHESAKASTSIAVVPLTIPIVAGPGAIATVVMMMKEHHTLTDMLRYSAASIGIAIVIGATFYFSPIFARILGESGLKIATRVMGMILVAIAIQTFAAGAIKLFPGLS